MCVNCSILHVLQIRNECLCALIVLSEFSKGKRVPLSLIIKINHIIKISRKILFLIPVMQKNRHFFQCRAANKCPMTIMRMISEWCLSQTIV